MKRSIHFVFAIPCLIGGAFALYTGLSAIQEWNEMKSWSPVPATVLFAELKEHVRRDSDGHRSTTYSVNATYEYEIDDRAYRSDRVAIMGGGDSRIQYHRERVHQLKVAQERGETVTCFVDPENPANAVLNRDLQSPFVGLLVGFGALFICLSIYIAWQSLSAIRLDRFKQAMRNAHPDKPWYVREEWMDGRIEYRAGRHALYSGIGAAVMTAIMVPVLMLAAEIMKTDPHPMVYILYLFPILSVIFTGIFVYRLMRWLKYGDSVFEMTPPPGVIGGSLTGRVMTSVRLPDHQAVTARLKAIHRYKTRSGGKTQTSEKTIWEQDESIQPLELSTKGFQTEIPVQIDIPEDIPESNDDDADSQHYWKLEVKADSEGVDYWAEFIVPVFAIQRVE